MNQHLYRSPVECSDWSEFGDLEISNDSVLMYVISIVTGTWITDTPHTHENLIIDGCGDVFLWGDDYLAFLEEVTLNQSASNIKNLYFYTYI